MEKEKLIGMRVRNTSTHAIGIIKYIQNGYIAIEQYGEIIKYQDPAAFAGILELEDENVQKDIEKERTEDAFRVFKSYFKFAINSEIEFLKLTGGKKV